jgi:hypothetical protein
MAETTGENPTLPEVRYRKIFEVMRRESIDGKSPCIGTVRAPPDSALAPRPESPGPSTQDVLHRQIEATLTAWSVPAAQNGWLGHIRSKVPDQNGHKSTKHLSSSPVPNPQNSVCRQNGHHGVDWSQVQVDHALLRISRFSMKSARIGCRTG